MELWFIVLVSLCLCLTIRAFFNLLSPSRPIPLPPGPPRIPIVSNILFLRKTFLEIEASLRDLRAKYGPIFVLPIRSRPLIFVADRFIAHQALVQNGAVFADRPNALATAKIFSCNQHDISSSFYGPTWRLLRRNLTSEMLHPTRVKSFSSSRKWVLDMLMNRLRSDSESGNPIKVIDHLQHAMFCLLVFMCFGEKLSEEQIKDIEHVQQRVLLSSIRFRVLNFWPRITRILFQKRWQELFQTRKEQESVLIPLIRARKKAMEDNHNSNSDQIIVHYVDTLLDLEWPEEKQKLEESEIVSVTSELINAGTDTTATALQWIMANLVKHPKIQEKIAEEIRQVIGDNREEKKEVKEEDLKKLPYLKAVILEGLRRHPPTHFVLPHAVKEDAELNGFLIPKNGTINFLVAEMGWDPKVWENPMEFKPERFLNGEKNGDEVFDITGSKEIKMMPFGAGRRMCPGYNVAMFHLEYFVANLVWNFVWEASNDGEVDLSEKQEFTVVMKNPLQVHISPRF